MTRVDNWQRHLAETITKWRDVTFEYGRYDCVHFAGDCVLATTGHDPIADWRGQYSTRKEGQRLQFQTFKTAGMIRLWPHVLQLTAYDNPLFAKMGDIGVAEGEDGQITVVNFGAYWLGLGRESGLAAVDTVIAAWPVGW